MLGGNRTVGVPNMMIQSHESLGREIQDFNFFKLFCWACLGFLLWILSLPKLSNLWNSYPFKNCKTYWTAILALCTISHREGLHTPSSASTSFHGLSPADDQYITWTSLWSRPALNPTDYTRSPPSNSHESNFIRSFTFSNLLLTILGHSAVRNGYTASKLQCN